MTDAELVTALLAALKIAKGDMSNACVSFGSGFSKFQAMSSLRSAAARTQRKIDKFDAEIEARKVAPT